MLDVAIVVVSDKILSGVQEDTGKSDVLRILQDGEMNVASYEVVADDRGKIAQRLRNLCEQPSPHVILTVGGTGVRPSDWAPEATQDVIEKEIPGIGEAMRSESLKKVQAAMLSRGTAGIRKQTLIVNLPGSPKGTRENLKVLVPIVEHTVEKIRGMSLSAEKEHHAINRVVTTGRDTCCHG